MLFSNQAIPVAFHREKACGFDHSFSKPVSNSSGQPLRNFAPGEHAPKKLHNQIEVFAFISVITRCLPVQCPAIPEQSSISCNNKTDFIGVCRKNKVLL